MKKAASKKGAVKGLTTLVSTWQDDPDSGLPAIQVPVPNLKLKPYQFSIDGPAVKPGEYDEGTAEFRYWNAAAALRRGGDFWAAILKPTQWEIGPILPVALDEGEDFNAYYDRKKLNFFHGTAGGKTVYSGESPDILCHEMGHACLDSHRPEVFDAPYIEAGAFHESFADTSAILSALQLPTVRAAALAGVKADKSSQLSRLAEQLGWAIRQTDPADVDKDCLRNAYNSFKYVDPQTLPDSAPATQLCAEVHSFSRIFTGAFYEILSGMLNLSSSSPTVANLAAVATDYANLLKDATAAAVIRPNYFAQVAAQLIDADAVRFNGKYRAVLTKVLVARKILPASILAAVAGSGASKSAVRSKKAPALEKHMIAAATVSNNARPVSMSSHSIDIAGKDVGLSAGIDFTVTAAIEHKHPVAISSMVHRTEAEASADVETATRRFVKMLVAHDRIDTSAAGAVSRMTNSKTTLRTHKLVKKGSRLQLVRIGFLCGCRV